MLDMPDETPESEFSGEREGGESEERETEEERLETLRLRTEMAAIGLIVDPSTLEEGEPLSPEDRQHLYRFRRDPLSMTEEERLRIIRRKRRYRTWYEADVEILLQVAKESGDSHGSRN